MLSIHGVILGILLIAISSGEVSVPGSIADQNGKTDKNKKPEYESRNLCNGESPDTTQEDSSFSVLDLKEKRLNIPYLLFTRQNSDEEYNLRPKKCSISKSPFNPCIGSIFLIHGYSVDLKKSNVMFDIKDELLKEGDYNVVVVNWTRYDMGDYWTQEITYQAKRVARDITNTIKVLMNTTSIIPESVYIVGHSLGAQIAGLVGKSIPNIGRITGVDAAGPGYNRMAKEQRLADTDAVFVDAMHTDGSLSVLTGYGYFEPYADQDYFINGGSEQPQCKMGAKFQDTNKKTEYVDSDENKISCNHDSAPFYYLYSINQCNFTAVQCDSYENFKLGKCSGNLVMRMGFHATPNKSLPSESKFYLQTTTEPPYCKQ